MDEITIDPPSLTVPVPARIRAGDHRALAELFQRRRDQLHWIVEREVVALRHLEWLSRAETAAVLGSSEEAGGQA